MEGLGSIRYICLGFELQDSVIEFTDNVSAQAHGCHGYDAAAQDIFQDLL